MAETQGVFDSLLKDISSLQKNVNSMRESRDIDQLEKHLSERIATFTENAMETTSVQGESLNSLNDRVHDLSNVVSTIIEKT